MFVKEGFKGFRDSTKNKSNKIEIGDDEDDDGREEMLSSA